MTHPKQKHHLKNSATYLLAIVITITIVGCTPCKKFFSYKDYTFKFEGAEIPVSGVPVNFKGFEFSTHSKFVSDTITAIDTYLRAKCQQCQQEITDSAKLQCYKERSELVSKLLFATLWKYQDSLQLEPSAYVWFNFVFQDSLRILIGNPYQKQYEAIDSIIKDYATGKITCQDIDKRIDNICDLTMANYRKSIERYFNFLTKYPQYYSGKNFPKVKEDVMAMYPFTGDCHSQFQYLKQALCNSCDTCGIIQRFCLKEKKSFDKEKCRCFVPKKDGDVLTSMISKAMPEHCQSIKTLVNRVNEGKDIAISIYYNTTKGDSICFLGKSLEKHGYAIGQYDIPIDLKIFLNQFLDSMRLVFDRNSWEDDFARVDIVGMADALGKGHLLHIPYLGYTNLGIKTTVSMNRSDYLIVDDYYNSQDYGHPDYSNQGTTFSPSGSSINSNIQLAYLRAVPVREMLLDHFPNLNQYSIFALESPNTDQNGSDRRIELHMLIRDVSLTGITHQFYNPWLKKMEFYYNKK